MTSLPRFLQGPQSTSRLALIILGHACLFPGCTVSNDPSILEDEQNRFESESSFREVYVDPTQNSWAVMQLPRSVGASDFGESLALSADGKTVLVGDSDGGELNFGQATVYQLDARTIPRAFLLGTPEDSQSFGKSVAISADGRVLLVGDPTGGENGAGAATFFERVEDDFRQEQRFSAIAGAKAFGGSVLLAPDGLRAFVGDAAGGISGEGQLVVFERSSEGESWQRVQALEAPPGALGFGSSMAMSADGSRIVVGSPLSEDLRGAVFLLQERDAVWVAEKIAHPTNAFRVGMEVSISGDGSVVSISHRQGAPDGPGRVEIHRLDGEHEANGPSNLSMAILSVDAASPDFGASVALSRDAAFTLVADRNGGVNEQGRVYFLDAVNRSRMNHAWAPECVVPRPDGSQNFGSTVRFSQNGSTFAVGDASGGGDTFGSVAIYLKAAETL